MPPSEWPTTAAWSSSKRVEDVVDQLVRVLADATTSIGGAV
jgi:hypothetical protein